MLFTVALQAQTKTWDFGNDRTTWPETAGIGQSEIVVDQLGLVPISGKDNFGQIDASNSSFSDSYTATHRFKMNGGGGVSDPVFMPTQRYMYFDVDGPCTVSVWMKTASGGTTRGVIVSDGNSQVGFASANDGTNGDLAILDKASYTGTGGRLYVYGNDNIAIIKMEVVGANITTPTLGIDDVTSTVSTNVKAVSNRIYVSNVKSSSEITIYSITGALVKSFKTNSDTNFAFKSGLYIATVKTLEGQKSVKLLLN